MAQSTARPVELWTNGRSPDAVPGKGDNVARLDHSRQQITRTGQPPLRAVHNPGFSSQHRQFTPAPGNNALTRLMQY
jgi:hypothetical protein